ncbi:hypothetical protein RYX36_018398 [Vicia faba]
MAAEKLRDLSQPIDVPLLNATVAAFYGTRSKEQRTAADQILRDLQNNLDMWLQVMHILQNTQNLNTKFFALQLSGNEASFRTERLYVNKLNIILVQILKHEWPARWKNFIPDLVSAAKTSETIFTDQSTFDAKVVGFDQDKDVAVLRVDAPKDKLRPIPVGVSAELLVGQKVYAIGNPFGLDHAPCHRKLPFQ